MKPRGNEVLDESDWDTTLASGTMAQKLSLLQELAAHLAVANSGLGEAALARLLGILRGTDAILQAEVCPLLVPLRGRAAEAFAPLMRLVYSNDAELQERAIAALGAVAHGNERALRALTSLFSGENARIGLQRAILQVFAAWGPLAASAAPLLVEIILNEHIVKRHVVGDYYYWWYDYEPPTHDDYMLQVEAAAALVSMEVQHPSLMEVLLRAYEAETFYGHLLVVHTWGRMGPRSMAGLDLIIRDYPLADAELRAAMIQTAFAMKGNLEEIIPLMLEGLASAEDVELRAARHALSNLTENHEAIEALRRLLPRHAGHQRLRGMAAYALGQLKADEQATLTALEPLVSDPAPYVRKQAMRAMRELGVEDNAMIAAYFRQINDPKEAIRCQAARALLERDAHPEAAYEVLVEVLQTQGLRLQKSWQRKYVRGIEKAADALEETMGILIAELESGPAASIPESTELFAGLQESLQTHLPSLDLMLRELGKDPLQRARVGALQETLRLLEEAAGASGRFLHWQETLEEALF